MQTKKTFYSEIAYILGILIMALGTAFMTVANFGLSMVVAPAYVVYAKLAALFPDAYITFGMAENAVQVILLIALFIIIRKVRLPYLFAFLTAILYGLSLDGFTLLINLIPESVRLLVWVRVIFFIVGMPMVSTGVALFFKTYFMPEVYDLFVKVISSHFGFRITVVKRIYDITCCVISLVLSFACFGWLKFVGVNWGTIVVTILNSFLIGFVSRFIDTHFELKDRFPFRKFFEGVDESKEKESKPKAD